MNLERGFRRFAIVLSVVVLGLGITLDATGSRFNTYILPDGRQLRVPSTWTTEQVNQAIDAFEALPRGPATIGAEAIAGVRALRGPEYWWWTDTPFTKVAIGLVGLLWGGFYVVRWIARGFRDEGQ